jgi:cytochrome c oxidase subunit 2
MTAPRPGGKRRRLGLVLATIIALAVGALYVILVLAGIFTNGSHQLTTLSPHGVQSQRIQDLITPVFIVAGIVWVGVFGAVLFICRKFRDEGDDPDDFPVQVEGNNRLELAWTIAPLVLLAVIAAFTVSTIHYLSQVPQNALHVEVSGQQWWWSFHYDIDGNGTYTDTAHGDVITATELVIPVNKPVQLSITSEDVIHSFWIPALNGKKDAVPGQHHPLTLEATKIGVYRGQCTQFCGLSHANMRMLVRVVSESDFQRWVANQQKTYDTQSESATAQAGKLVFEQQLCSSCHLIRGINDKKISIKYGGQAPDGGTASKQLVSGVAPDLTHIATRGTFAGSIYNLYTPIDSKTGKPLSAFDVWDPGQPGNALYGGDPAPSTWNVPTLSAWLRNPPAMKPMYAGQNVPADMRRGMPNLHLSELQITELVAFLESLR